MRERIADQPHRCTNAEPGTFNHECGKPAVWIGTNTAGHEQQFCDDCKARGWEAAGRTFRKLR
jgi:hypothetical protein